MVTPCRVVVTAVTSGVLKDTVAHIRVFNRGGRRSWRGEWWRWNEWGSVLAAWIARTVGKLLVFFISYVFRYYEELYTDSSKSANSSVS